jgi:intergrase/recombinase
MNITSAQYTTELKTVIKATMDGTEMFVPPDPNNREYAEILRQVKEGTLTIKDAD